jgi:phosphoribosyl 1,2-cyclic phosphodiesterase
MFDQPRFLVRFWGVRGSYPTPGPKTVRYGGNTSCVEIQAGAHTLILDAGSGIIQLGEHLLQQTPAGPLDLSVFFTHAHGDHLIGFPFFLPLFEKRASLHFFGPGLGDRSIEQILLPIMSPPYFPVDLRSLPSKRLFHTITDQELIAWGPEKAEPQVILRTATQPGNDLCVYAQYTHCHPQDGAVCYRVEYGGRSLIFATDVEWEDECDEEFRELARGTDLLIHDAQYTTPDYQHSKQGFGHSTIEMATSTANCVEAKRLVLFHHDPGYDDEKLDQMQMEARRFFANTQTAYEGLEIDLLA